MNTQPIEKQDIRPDGMYLHSIWPTIQGEGPNAGMSCVFIRVAGCNLQCPACDTDYTSRKLFAPWQEIIDKINSFRPNYQCPLVVITGGEPLRQNTAAFTSYLLCEGYRVQIETNGVYPILDSLLDPNVQVVVSPKTPKINEVLMKPDIYHNVYFKYILKEGFVDELDGLPSITLDGVRPARPGCLQDIRYRTRFFVQPQDDNNKLQNEWNRKAAVESCMRYGYRLSYQIHKELGLK